jgi:hypothetical protein
MKKKACSTWDLKRKDSFLSKSTCDRFLKLMKKYQVDGKLDISEVPGDMRTLIKCSEKIMVKEQYGGKTMYLGIKRFIQMLLKNSINLPETIIFNINIDGAPVFENPYTNITLWPVLM